MDPITSNVIIDITGIAVGSIVAIISAFSACFLKSHCTTINTPCISCERDVLQNVDEQRVATGQSPVPAVPTVLK